MIFFIFGKSQVEIPRVILIKKISIILFLTFFANLTAQEIQIPGFSLNGIKTPVKISAIPDSVNSVYLTIIRNNKTENFKLFVKNSTVDTSVIFPSAGNYKVRLNIPGEVYKEIRILPGWFSVIPPLVAILLALIIRQVLVSLFIGIYIGTILIYNFDPVEALLRLADTLILNVLVDYDHMYVIVFTLLIGGVVGIISQNGGTEGLARQITKLAKTAKSGMIASWLMGLVIFFDDYANSLIIGNMMRPITDKLKISREKLAYIVDSTAAPVASLVIISTWIGYELGLIAEGLKTIGSGENAYDVFLKTIPYRFYPIAAIFFVFLTSFLERDFGPMLKAELRARKEGKLTNDDVEIKTLDLEKSKIPGEKKANWINGAVPILIILLGTVTGLVYTGMLNLEAAGSTNYSLQNIISHSDSYKALLWSSLLAGIVAVIMSVSQRLLNLHDSMNAWHKGVQTMLFAVIILVFAWGISKITVDLKTADYLISLLSESLNPKLLPVLVFVICGAISFATGTSWGTMAIVMPIVIPLASEVSAIAGLSAAGTTIIIHGVISSVLAGSVWGDHCSPIADTTILSSMASQCNHIDHVRTQLPYALSVGAVSMLIGDFLTAYGLNPFVAIFIIFALLYLILMFFGKKVRPDNLYD